MKMTKRKNSSVDGFIPRRVGDQLGGLHLTGNKKSIKSIPETDKLLINRDIDEVRNLGQSDIGRDIGGLNMDNQLSEIDELFKPTEKLSRKQKKLLKRQTKRPKSLIKKIIRVSIFVLIFGFLSIGGYFTYKFISAGNSIFQGNVLGLLSSQPLQKDSFGRTNFLVLGTSEDDPDHQAGYLTDSIIIVSISQEKKDIYMFNVPRDLKVRYGMACPEGYSGKINSYFSCINDGSTDSLEQERLASMREMIGGIVGLDIQYSIHANWSVLRDVVDAVGGVDIDVQGSNGAPGVLDRNFDWRCDYKCYYVNYDNGVHHMDGEHALFFALARGDSVPTYGLSRSNPDREANQQKIMIALRKKAGDIGVLTNLSFISKMIDALGNNLRTNVQTKEIRTLVQAVGEINTDNIRTLNLIDGDEAVMNGSGNPKDGDFEYGGFQDFVKKNVNSNPVSREAAPIVVLNGSAQSGLAKTKADELEAQGFNIALIANASDGEYANVEIYKIDDGNEATSAKLKELYNVEIKSTKPPVLVNGNVKFVVIFGSTNI
ncbi:MAG: LCP family protein [Candidatus Saccharibacteria bacterium]